MFLVVGIMGRQAFLDFEFAQSGFEGFRVRKATSQLLLPMGSYHRAFTKGRLAMFENDRVSTKYIYPRPSWINILRSIMKCKLLKIADVLKSKL